MSQERAKQDSTQYRLVWGKTKKTKQNKMIELIRRLLSIKDARASVKVSDGNQSDSASETRSIPQIALAEGIKERRSNNGNMPARRTKYFQSNS
jgi:hypothetical protein